MSALALGIAAALCWGFHDFCVRFLSQKTPISACIFVVLLTGLVFHLIVAGLGAGFAPQPWPAVWLSLGAGGAFVVASFGLYAAFERGPVRLVAPLIASYPILSMAWAVWQGTPLTWLLALAVLFIVSGVGMVAALSDTSADEAPPIGRTVAFALIAAAGFAGTFAFGQAAAELGDEATTTLITRILAVALTAAVLWLGGLAFWPGRAALPLLMLMGIADGIALWCVLAAGDLPQAAYASVASSVFGLLTIVLAWAFLKERMSALQWLGCLMTFAGLGYLAL